MEDGTGTYTIDDALVSMGFGKFQALVLAYSGMGWASEAMEVMLLSFIGPSVRMEWGISPDEESLIASVVFVGMLIGAYSWGIVSDNYGRRKGFLFTALVTSCAGLLSSFSPNYLCLIASRFAVGVGLGGAPVLSSWFLEFVPVPTRGTWMLVLSLFWSIGTMLEVSLAWVIMPRIGWRWLLAVSSLPSFILLLFYGFTPESPRYLCSKGRRYDAVAVLEKMAEMNQVPLPSGTLTSDFIAKLDCNLIPSEETHLTTTNKSEALIDEDFGSSTRSSIALFDLLSPKLIKATLLLWIVFFGTAFAYYGIVLLTTELSKSCALNGLPSHDSNSNSYKDVFLSSFGEIPGILVPAAIMDRVGRKPLLSCMLFMSCVLLMPLIFDQNESIRTILLFGARTFITGSFNSLYVYAPEIYPTSLRTTGVGVASSYGRLGGIICPFVAVSMVRSCHGFGAILIFQLVTFLSGAAVCLFPLETRGRALTDTLLN